MFFGTKNRAGQKKLRILAVRYSRLPLLCRSLTTHSLQTFRARYAILEGLGVVSVVVGDALTEVLSLPSVGE
jgi:hypothetical protein